MYEDLVELQLCHGFNDRITDLNRDRILLRIKRKYKQKRKRIQKGRKYKLFAERVRLHVPVAVDNNTAYVTAPKSFLESLSCFSMIHCIHSSNQCFCTTILRLWRVSGCTKQHDQFVKRCDYASAQLWCSITSNTACSSVPHNLRRMLMSLNGSREGQQSCPGKECPMRSG